MLHGGPGAPGSVASLARELAADFRVREPLQRRGGEVRLTVAQHVADLRQVCEQPAVLVGWSWGAMLGLSFAAAHPERVRALVLVGCGTYDEASRASYRATMDQRLAEPRFARVRELRARRQAATDPVVQAELLRAMAACSGQVQAHDRLPDDGEGELPVDAVGHAETWADVLERQRAGVEPAAFAAITAPVLMLHGVDDPHPGAATRDTLRRFVPQLEYRAFDRCGHEPWLERHAREPFLAALRGWLQTQAARR